MGILSTFIKIAVPVAAWKAWSNYRASHSSLSGSSDREEIDTGFSSSSDAPGDDYPADEDVGRA